MATIHWIKAKAKRGPRMSRQLRAEYVSVLAGGEPRTSSPEVAAKLKKEIVRIGCNGTRQGFKFAELMFKAYPELRGA